VIKDAESADMVGRANVGYFLLRSPTASMAMTASCEAYAQVKWSLVTVEDATLEVWVRFVWVCDVRSSFQVLPVGIAPRARHMIGSFFESLATEEFHQTSSALSGNVLLFASQIHNPIPSIYTQNRLQPSTANVNSSKPSMADVVGLAAHSLWVPPNSGPLSHLPPQLLPT
jgi:hypothetical protein